jgi:hypothetical protein
MPSWSISLSHIGSISSGPGLTDDEYFWQPVHGCWTISRRGESKAPVSFGAGEFTMDYAEPPRDREPVTTIAWRRPYQRKDIGTVCRSSVCRSSASVSC